MLSSGLGNWGLVYGRCESDGKSMNVWAPFWMHVHVLLKLL